MSDFPLVSVIIPAYNSAKFLEKTLESVFSQTWPHKEIIVVDDGSTDGTAEVLNKYSTEVYSIYQRNQGSGAARNTGIHAAKGDFFGFLDADDLWTPEFLEVQVKFLQENPKIDVVYSWWRYIDRDGNPLPEEGRFCERGNLLRFLAVSNRFTLMTALVRRKCIEAVGSFCQEPLMAEDWDLWSRIALHGFQFDFSPRVMSEYRFHGTNKTLDVALSQRVYLAVIDRLYSEEYNLPAEIRQLKGQAYSGVYLTIAISDLQAGKIEDAKRAILDGVRYWPELVFQEDTYYRLICADQPPGYRATQYFKDLDRAKDRIDLFLHCVFDEPALKLLVAPFEHRARAISLTVFAQHYYLAEKNAEARHLIEQAVRIYPQCCFSRNNLGLWLRSLLGRKQVERIKKQRVLLARRNS